METHRSACQVEALETVEGHGDVVMVRGSHTRERLEMGGVDIRATDNERRTC